jgi:DNA-binding MarR family transcriptional regulator
LEFDAHMTSPARLSIIACLVPGEALTFTELKQEAKLTDGNLHAQSRKLAAAGYIEILEVVRGARSLTGFRITELGLEALKLHVQKLQAALATETRAVRCRSTSSRDDDSQVWS